MQIMLTAMLVFSAAVSAAPSNLAELASQFRSGPDVEPIRVLVVTATHGYRHAPAIDAARALLGALNATTEFQFEFTEDVDDFNPATLNRFDLLFFANSTLRVDEPDTPAAKRSAVADPVTAAHRAAIIEFLNKGGGFVGAHSALDALYGWKEYRQMVGGGLFDSHPWTQEVRIRIENAGSPATAHLADQFAIKDEIYVLDDNPRKKSHILLSLDTSSVDLDKSPAAAERADVPISWRHEHGGGRIFMTKLGHFPEVWTNPAFIEHLLQGMRVTAGRLTKDATAKQPTRQTTR